MGSGAYSFVSKANLGICVPNNNSNDGTQLQVSPSSNISSSFALIPVTTGEWSGKACHIKTFCSKTV